MKRLYRIFIAIGIFMLATGFALYVRLVMVRQGSLGWVFFFCMGCLLFFNLPTVCQRWIDRRDRLRNEEDDASPR